MVFVSGLLRQTNTKSRSGMVRINQYADQQPLLHCYVVLIAFMVFVSGVVKEKNQKIEVELFILYNMVTNNTIIKLLCSIKCYFTSNPIIYGDQLSLQTLLH